MADRNAGKSAHTAKFIPWELVWYSAFPDKYSSDVEDGAATPPPYKPTGMAKALGSEVEEGGG